MRPAQVNIGGNAATATTATSATTAGTVTTAAQPTITFVGTTGVKFAVNHTGTVRIPKASARRAGCETGVDTIPECAKLKRCGSSAKRSQLCDYENGNWFQATGS